MTRRLPHIVCYAPYTNWSIHSAREVTILQALRLRGCSVSYVACDGVYPVCDMTHASNGVPIDPGARACLDCQSSVSARLAAWGMPYRWFGRWLRTSDFETARLWVASLSPEAYTTARFKRDTPDETWDVGAWVRSSVHTHLRHNVLDLGDTAVAAVYAQYLYSGLVACFGLSRLFDQEKPDILLLFNGRMSSTRIAFELATRRGIRTICEERGIVAGRLTLYDNGTCLDLTGTDALWDNWKGVPLTAAEIATTAQFLEERWQGRSTDVSAFSAGMEDMRKERARLGLSADKPLWVLYTSNQDEVADAPRVAGIFQSQVDWIKATIAYVRDKPDTQLVIRVHPNTGSARSLGRNSQDEQFVAALARDLPGNVRLVHSDDGTSSYTLAAMADFGLVWHSTIGVEMAAMGRPVIRAGASWLANCGFFIPAATPAEYVAALDTAHRTRAKAGPDQIAGAWRFTYAWYFRQTIPFPMVAQPRWFVGEPTYTTLEALAPGKDPDLDHICAVFIDNAPLHPPPEQRAADVGAAEATDIASRIARFRTREDATP